MRMPLPIFRPPKGERKNHLVLGHPFPAIIPELDAEQVRLVSYEADCELEIGDSVSQIHRSIA
jgi:hypothetical protein